MARKQTSSQRAAGAADDSGESVAGYFRKIFKETP
jgi:hypothetical protein